MTSESSKKTNREITLLEELSQARALLNNTTEALEEERRIAAAPKNKVVGGFYMMSRQAEKNLRALQKNNKNASLIFSVLREHMQIGTNAVTVSNTALSKILNISTRTVVRSTNFLREHNYVQIVKTGTTNSYIVNEQVAFAGAAGQRRAVFSATVVAHECEQDEGWDIVKKLKAAPIILDNERVLVGVDDIPPPDQKDLDLD